MGEDIRDKLTDCVRSGAPTDEPAPALTPAKSAGVEPGGGAGAPGIGASAVRTGGRPMMDVFVQ